MTARISRRDLIAGAAAGGFLAARRLRGQASDPTTLTIVDAARLVASRQLSPLELTRAYLARIEQQNGRLNAYITVTADAALAQARALEAEISAVVANVDLLVTPTTRVMPGTVADPPTGLIRNTVPFNALGIPTISVPCGFSRGGFPIGLQVSGPRLGEARVLALAHAYEQATEWHRRQPALS